MSKYRSSSGDISTKKGPLWPTCSTDVRTRTPRTPRRHSAVPRAATVSTRACLSRGGTRGTAIWLGSYSTCLILSSSSAFGIVWGTRTPLAPRIHLNNELKIIARCVMKTIMVGGRIHAGFDLASENGYYIRNIPLWVNDDVNLWLWKFYWESKQLTEFIVIQRWDRITSQCARLHWLFVRS